MKVDLNQSGSPEMEDVMAPNDIVKAEFSLEYIQNVFPNEFSASLERSWLDDYEVNSYPIVKGYAGDIVSDARFLQIFEVAQTLGSEKNSHLGNMQNVISSLRGGGHSLVYSVLSDGVDVNLFTGVRNFDRKPENKTKEYIGVLHKSLRSNFPGIVLSKKPGEGYSKVPLDTVLDPIHS